MTDGSANRLRYLGHRLVMYGFVGVSLANSQDIDLNPIPICKHLTDLFSTSDEPVPKPVGQKLEDFEFGSLIAKGCDAAVYDVLPVKQPMVQPVNQAIGSPVIEAIVQEEVVEEMVPEEEEFVIVHEETYELVDSSDSESSDTDSSDVEMESVSSSTSSETVDQPESLIPERLCIKVMFNYGNSSNSAAIERIMWRELVPARQTDDLCDNYLRGAHVKKKKLPPHPNIVAVYDWFVAETPLLEDALNMYPDALPYRLCPDGCGRNKTLFIVMKRYESTLAEYIHECGGVGTRDGGMRDGVLLLLQLLHGIQHLQEHGVAHRDLKSDNLLVEWREGCPQLVISDFGHCLTAPLRMSYHNDNMDKGGNGKLMAPEIAIAEPGPGAYLDFRASDSWAAGTIAYEIFAGANPFYTTAFDSRTYREDELPSLPPTVPACVRRVVAGLLHRDPAKRLPVSVAASVLAVWLWGPWEWQHSPPPPTLEVSRWLVQLSAATLLHVPEARHMKTFLGGLDWEMLGQAVRIVAEG